MKLGVLKVWARRWAMAWSSLATKAVFVGLTAFGMASMWGAIAADVGVSLLVVMNALRLLNSKAESGAPKGGEPIGETMAKGALAHGH